MITLTITFLYLTQNPQIFNKNLRPPPFGLENRYLYVTDARKANTPAFLGGQGVVGGNRIILI